MNLKFVRIEIYSTNYKLAQIYKIEAKLSREDFLFIAQEMLANKSSNWRIYFSYSEEQENVDEWVEPQNDQLIKHPGSKFLIGNITKHIEQENKIIQVSYHPGVTDNLANTLKKMVEQKFSYHFTDKDSIYTTKLFVQNCEYQYNPLIESYTAEVAKTINVKEKIYFSHSGSQDNCEQVKDIYEYNQRNLLGLSKPAISVIQQYFADQRRQPYDVELETLAQTWSEHCKHTIFSSPIDDITDGLYKTYIKGATAKIMQEKPDFCVSVFSDNAGAIQFTDDWLIAVKVETHNSPSAIEPFGGAITGIVGVNRDIIGFGQGAKPIANMYGFCFADPTQKYNLFLDHDMQKPILEPQRIIEGVIKGIEVGGNCSGIPTAQGFIHYDKRFIAKPLVFAGTIGLIPTKINDKPSHIKEPKDGDYIVVIGGYTGKDGIHGATFSSDALDNECPNSVVQIGDPITQKKLSDALIKEARDLDLYNAITDNGAGGLSSSVGEMGQCGFEVELETVPLKYPGMKPWEIWVSESQERMTLSVPANKYDKLCEIMRKHDVNITKIGTFNYTGIASIKYKGDIILNINTDFLHNGNPTEHLKTEEIDILDKPKYTEEINLQEHRFVVQQYDHEVQGNSVLKPLQGIGKYCSDASVIKPVLSLNRGLAMSQGLGVLHDDTEDPYYTAANAIDTAIRNLIVVGVNPDKIALLDNFCWSDSTNPKRLWQLKRTAKACHDYAVAFKAPFVSGKDSMFNDFKGYVKQENGSAQFVHLTDPPTLLITAIGIVDKIEHCVSLDAKFPGDLVYLLGENNTSKVDAQKSMSLYYKLHEAMEKNLITSAISIHRGGVKHAIKRAANGGKLNIRVSHNKYLSREEYPSRILVTINPDIENIFRSLFPNSLLIGEVTA